MVKIAILFFPGQNTELETLRAIEAVGMKGTVVRWNEPKSRLQEFDGFIIPGGFSYEDRGRAGLVASLDPMIAALKKEAEKEKPVLGICNGAQVLVESGLVPGAKNYTLAMALARNKRMRGGQVLGTGYYNEWIYLKQCVKPKRSAFTLALKPDELYRVPVAHAEGRFETMHPKLIEKLFKNEQVVFQYCDREGNVAEEFPTNPNGALANIAGLCNSEGNVMALMPHAERGIVAPIPAMFKSMRMYCTQKKSWTFFRPKPLIFPPADAIPRKQYKAQKTSLEFFIDLIITDNEAYTLQEAAHSLGFHSVTLSRQTYFEVDLREEEEWERKARQLIACGVLLNTNKEIPTVAWKKRQYKYGEKNEFTPYAIRKSKKWTFTILVQEKQDFVGMSKKTTLRKRLHYDWVGDVKKGIVWHIKVNEKSQQQAKKIYQQLLKSHIFGNPHAQDCFIYTA